MIAFKVPAPRPVPLELDERGKLTLSREVEILRRFVRCGSCGKFLRSRSEYVYDHEIAIELGGADETRNMRPLCLRCDGVKTAKDLRLIVRRLAGETATESRRPLPGGRASDDKRKISGRYVDRATGEPIGRFLVRQVADLP